MKNIEFWLSIEKDFEYYRDLATNLQAEKAFDIEDVFIEGMPEGDKLEDNINYTLSILVNTLDEIEDLIKARISTPKFLWLWGEFQKAGSYLFAVRPEYKNKESRQKWNRSQDKELQRRWYSVWYDYYLLEVGDGKPNRGDFENDLERTLFEIKTGKRILRPEMEFEGLIEFINLMTDDPSNEDNFILSANFRDKALYKKKREAALEKAYEESHLIPPAGKGNYPYSKK